MGRSPCCDNKSGMKKGPWTPEEDLKLIQHIQLHGPGNWRTLPKNAGLQRCGKSCRLRWTNYLRPDIKRGRFSFDEEETIIQLHSVLGNKWSAIAARLPGRTDNEIKNYWNTHIRKRLLRSGIDPVTHSPRLDLLDLSSLLNLTQLNLSNTLGLQALVNPEVLRLLSTLVATQNENPQLLFQKLQEIQSQNDQNAPIQSSTFQPSDQFLDSFQTSNNVYPSSSFPMQANVQQFTMNAAAANLNGQVKNQENLTPSNGNRFTNLENHGYFGHDISLSDTCNRTNLSSPASTTFVNSGSCTEDEKENDYCSNLMKFEIPESLDQYFEDLL